MERRKGKRLWNSVGHACVWRKGALRGARTAGAGWHGRARPAARTGRTQPLAAPPRARQSPRWRRRPRGECRRSPEEPGATAPSPAPPTSQCASRPRAASPRPALPPLSAIGRCARAAQPIGGRGRPAQSEAASCPALPRPRLPSLPARSAGGSGAQRAAPPEQPRTQRSSHRPLGSATRAAARRALKAAAGAAVGSRAGKGVGGIPAGSSRGRGPGGGGGAAALSSTHPSRLRLPPWPTTRNWTTSG